MGRTHSGGRKRRGDPKVRDPLHGRLALAARERKVVMVYGDINAIRRDALYACRSIADEGKVALYMKGGPLALDHHILQEIVQSDMVLIGTFSCLSDLQTILLKHKPSLLVIDTVNGGVGWTFPRRLSSDLFSITCTARSIGSGAILICEETTWEGVSRPRHHSIIRRFCDLELEIRLDILEKETKKGGGWHSSSSV